MLRLIKVILILAFVFLSYESFSKNFFRIKKDTDINKIKIANTQLINEIMNKDEKTTPSNFRKKTDQFFNYSLSGIFINGISKTFNITSAKRLVDILQIVNIAMLVLVFAMLLVWIDIEFGFMPSILAGSSIILSPYYAALSNFITISVFSMLLPPVVLAFSLLIERLQRTYLQRRITSLLFFTIMIRLSISYRSIFFIIFSVIIVSIYHGFYYKWERKFAINRMISFLKTMLYSFLCVCVFQIGVDSLINKRKFIDSFKSVLNNLTYSFDINEAFNTIKFIFTQIYIYPHVSCLVVFIIFFIISLSSVLFYYKILKVHQRQFYSLFLMAFSSYVMAIISSIFEISSPSYVAVMWMFPSTIFTFAILGLLISNVYAYSSTKTPIDNDENTN